LNNHICFQWCTTGCSKNYDSKRNRKSRQMRFIVNKMIVELESTQPQEGVNCGVRFLQLFWQTVLDPVRTGCSWVVQKWKSNEIECRNNGHRIFTRKTPLAQLRWKNHDLSRVGFNHFTKRAEYVTIVTHLVTNCNPRNRLP